MKLFGPECNNLCEADVKGLFVNLLATLALPVEPGQEKFEVEHQKLIVNGGSEDIYHYHDVTCEIFTVEQGNLTAFVNGESIPLERGATIIMEPGDKHKMVNKGSDSATVIETRLNVSEGDRHEAICP